MKILLANIGNRNITLNGNVFTKSHDELSFREWSKNILNDYERYKSDLDINIINPLIKSQNRYDKLMFYYSDMSGLDDRIDQDTLYEADIMKKVLIEKYNYTAYQIELIKCEAKVYNNGELMKFYRKSLKEIKEKYREAKITICDAGGTAQQKMALKIMSEYYLNKDNYEVKYTQHNKIIDDVPLDEYRKIIDAEIAIKLLHFGEYNAIIDLLEIKNIEELTYSKKTKDKNLLAHVFFRFSGNIKSARKNLTPKTENSILKNFYSGIENNDALNSLYNINDNYLKIKIADYLRKAHFYFNVHKFSQSILSFSQFYEALFSLVIKNDLDNQIYGTGKYQNDEQENALEQLIKTQSPLIYETLKSNEKCRFNLGDLSTQNLILSFSDNESLQNISKILSPYIEFSYNGKEPFINRLRNKIAHDGMFVSISDIENVYSYYPELLHKITDIFKLKDIDLFEKMNSLVEEKLFR